MKKLITLLACFILTGCPSGNRAVYDNDGWISINGNRVCYSGDKKEVLTSYYLESYEGNKPNIVLSSGYPPVNLSYPNTCFNVYVKSGVRYTALYILDGLKYRYSFILDTDGNAIKL